MRSGIQAKLYLLTTEEGGRRTGIASGYRPPIYFDDNDNNHGYDGVITLENQEQASPGEEFSVRIDFLHPELVSHLLKRGTRFNIREGERVVATGTIIKPLSSPLELQRKFREKSFDGSPASKTDE
jgi:translation elongation factor EF-Tu-like GTPase